MIKSMNKQMTINAISVVKVDTPTGETEVPINYMSASIQSDGKLSVNQAIQNESVYFQNLETAKNDYDAFYDYVVDLAKQETN